jgi:two-component system, cell cycle sensor histidine kinase and response regulator CckA
MLRFSRKSETRVSEESLRELAERTIALLRNDYRIKKEMEAGALEIRREFDPDLPGVPCAATEIQQVLLNLLTNAAHALREDSPRRSGRPGRIDVRTRWEGDWACLDVIDSGPGIEASVQRRIFEPFFTTKGPGKGSGMGLAMVYGILRQHGGSIRVESEPGAGARFGIFLPLAEAGAGAPQAAAAPAVLMHGKGCILVVDDEAVVRATATELLRYLGYVVLHAEGGREALDIYRARGAEIDLVLLDLMMPDLDGRETLVELRALDPKVCVVLSSGYGFEDLIDSLPRESLSGFARKPYQLAELSRIVGLALGMAEDEGPQPAADAGATSETRDEDLREVDLEPQPPRSDAAAPGKPAQTPKGSKPANP